MRPFHAFGDVDGLWPGPAQAAMQSQPRVGATPHGVSLQPPAVLGRSVTQEPSKVVMANSTTP
eukprot:1249360-Alexandrium_andersonii.AAC.1